MIKTIDELQEEAEYLQLMVDLSAASEADYRQEALKAAADKLMYQYELDRVERALIVASGETS